MEKRTLIAMVLSGIFIFIWFNMINKKQEKPMTTQESTVSSAVAQTGNSSQVEDMSVRAQQLKQKDYVLNTGSEKIIIDSVGGAVKSWQVKEEAKNVELVLEKTEKLSAVKNQNLRLKINNSPVVFLKSIEKADGLILEGFLGKSIRVQETWTFSDKEGLVDLEIQFENLTNSLQNLESVSIGLGQGLKSDKQDKNNQRLLRSLAWDGQKLHKKIKPKVLIGNMKWIAISNHYFMSSLIDKSNFFQIVEVTDKKVPTLNYKQALLLNPKEIKTISLGSYWGLREYGKLQTIGYGLERVAGVSFLGKGILKVLHSFYKITKNYGIAIILLTTLLQILMFPLTRKSYKSMHMMRMLQPQLNDLRAKYKNDSQRLNMEIMGLYKQKKVNPLGGCLPMLLQLPIFWALFSTLRNATELRYAGFMLWITDLSKPDTIAQIGQIPINVLPLLMGISMFLQQKMNATSGDPSQRTMMFFMPILFTFMFWNFPSGLVLYWFVSSIYTFSLQLWIGKQHK